VTHCPGLNVPAGLLSSQNSQAAKAKTNRLVDLVKNGGNCCFWSFWSFWRFWSFLRFMALLELFVTFGGFLNGSLYFSSIPLRYFFETASILLRKTAKEYRRKVEAVSKKWFGDYMAAPNEKAGRRLPALTRARPDAKVSIE
jgi:hypothetical protein